MRTDINSDNTFKRDANITVKDFARRSALVSLQETVSKAVDDLRDKVVRARNANVRSEDFDEIEVIITGHSLGGGVGTIFAHEFALVSVLVILSCASLNSWTSHRSLRPDVAVNLVTFGSPRVGTPAFKKSFHLLTNLQYLRVQNGCDAASQIPVCGFTHVGKHLWLVPRWITWILWLDKPAVPIGPDDAERGLATKTQQPWPFDKQCCVPPCCKSCSPDHRLPYDGRTFAGPNDRPPFLAACPCCFGLCCGWCFVGSSCLDDHDMMRYIHILNQPKSNPYWYTVLTEREAIILAGKRTWLDDCCSTY